MQRITELNTNLNIVCPLPRRTEKSVVKVENNKLKLAFNTIQIESPTSISMPTLLLAHVNIPVYVTKIEKHFNDCALIFYKNKFYLQT